MLMALTPLRVTEVVGRRAARSTLLWGGCQDLSYVIGLLCVSRTTKCSQKPPGNVSVGRRMATATVTFRSILLEFYPTDGVSVTDNVHRQRGCCRSSTV